ncbi:MAG TPA: efflux transporter outer membrane subunit [Planctomycetota bacterium]|nr:efflux transporter outer membrane subunit [Planctomycetota bacterium]
MNRRLLVVCLLGLAPNGCTVGPDYAPPEIAMPQGWRELEGKQGESLANVPWWELYPDPVLHDLIKTALEHNLDLRIAVERIEEARARYGFTRADLWPKVDVGAGARTERISEESLPNGPTGADIQRSVYGAGASASWEIDLFGRIRRASEAQQAILFSTEHARAAIVLALVGDVAQAYVELRDFDRRLEIANATVLSRRQYLELVRIRYEGGLTSELDFRQAEAELHRTEAQMHDFERLVTQKENELNLLLGRNPGPIPRGAAVATMPLPPQVPAGLPSELLQRRPDLAAAEQDLVAANARIGEAKALLYPSISLTGFFGFESTELQDLATAPARTWSLGANLLQPIFNSGQLQSRVEVAESLERQTLAAYEQAILRALREVEDSLVGYRKFGERRSSESSRVAAERQVLALAEVRYRGDVAPYLDVLDAQRSLLDSELSEAEAIRDQYVSLIQLYKALGGGWPAEPAAAAPPTGEPPPAGG